MFEICVVVHVIDHYLVCSKKEPLPTLHCATYISQQPHLAPLHPTPTIPSCLEPLPDIFPNLENLDARKPDLINNTLETTKHTPLTGEPTEPETSTTNHTLLQRTL